MKASARVWAGSLVACSVAAMAAGGGGGGPGGGDDSRAAEDAAIVAAQAAMSRQDWNGAQAVLKEALAAFPQNADYHNLYAYALRRQPNPDMKLVFAHYEEALHLDPEHRGAHEYIGEAYLMVGDLPKAKKHLAALDRLCFFGCEEYRDLKEAVARYEAGPKR